MTQQLLDFARICHQGGEFAHAEGAYRRILESDPANAEVLGLLGGLLIALERAAEAAGACRQSLRLRPGHGETLGNLGVALLKAGRADEAVARLREAREAAPERAEIGIPLANALRASGRRDEAIPILREVVRVRPDDAVAHNDLGVALRDAGRYDEASDGFRRAIGLDPRFALAHSNLGTTLQDAGRVDEAIASYDEAIRLRPGDPDARWNRATARLLLGEFADGWADYGWRWAASGVPAPRLDRPSWDGSPLGGRTILLHAEQGLGDTLQFVRYASLVGSRGGKVILACQGALVDLVSRCPGVDGVISFGSPRPGHDVQAALMDLPHILRTTLETVPAEVPYLFAEPGRVAAWRERLGGERGLKVGIAWQGRPEHPRDGQRSFPLASFEGIDEVAGVRWFSLQHGAGSEQLSRPRKALEVRDLGLAGGTVEDTAAAIANLDLVITPDTAIAHLAGGLGVPTWVALPFAPDWRWLLDRADSPWYPSVRLFRQSAPGDWRGVFDQLARALADRAGDHS